MNNNLYSIPSTAPQQYFVDNFIDIKYQRYRQERRRLQLELLKLQEYIASENLRVVVVLEGRDAAGKGSTARNIVNHLNPRTARVVHLGIPNQSQMRNWFRVHEELMPDPGELVVFDRSWYSRAMVQPVMGYCTMNQYKYFIRRVNSWEEELVNNEIKLIKIYLSVSQESQLLRFNLRETSDLKYWKFSGNDRAASEKWHLYTYFKERMFAITSTDYAPWNIINSDNKLSAHLSSIHLVLDKFDYPKKDQIYLGEVTRVDELDKMGSIEIDGVWFNGLTQQQFNILERLKIHAD